MAGKDDQLGSTKPRHSSILATALNAVSKPPKKKRPPSKLQSYTGGSGGKPPRSSSGGAATPSAGSVVESLLMGAAATKEATKPEAFEMPHTSRVPSEWFARAEKEKDEKKVQAADEFQVKREDRADVLGITTGALNTTPPELKRLTEKEYFKLSDRQRAAVDFNTMLAGAVRKDKRRQDKYKTETDATEKLTYETSVIKMFGEEGGSDLYAPETMAVLRQLKIDDKAADLDQYLGLEVAITSDDLKSLTVEAPMPTVLQSVTGVAGGSKDRDQVINEQVDRTVELQAALARGNDLLQNFQATSAAERGEDLRFLGGNSPLAGRPALGYGQGEVDQYFNMAFDTLGDKTNFRDRDEILGVIKSELNSDEFKAFIDYADSRTKNTMFYDAKLGDTKDVQYPSAERYREILGLSE